MLAKPVETGKTHIASSWAVPPESTESEHSISSLAERLDESIEDKRMMNRRNRLSANRQQSMDRSSRRERERDRFVPHRFGELAGSRVSDGRFDEFEHSVQFFVGGRSRWNLVEGLAEECLGEELSQLSQSGVD